MSVQIPAYMTGRNISLFTITNVGLDTNTNLSLGMTYNLRNIGVFKSFEFEGDLNSSDIHSGNATIANYVPEFDDFNLSVNEIRQANGYSYLEDLYFNNLYFRIAAQASAISYNGTGAIRAGYQFVAYGLRASIRSGMQEGENVVTLGLKPCGIQPYLGPNPPY